MHSMVDYAAISKKYSNYCSTWHGPQLSAAQIAAATSQADFSVTADKSCEDLGFDKVYATTVPSKITKFGETVG